MDYQNDKPYGENQEGLVSPEPLFGQGKGGPKRQPAKPRSRSGGGFWKILMGILLAVSIIGNFLLFFMLIAVAAFVAEGTGSRAYRENVIRKGDSDLKIVVIRLEGVIDGEQSEYIRRQLRAAREDDNVHAVIIRTVSPGGSVSSSDQIHHELLRFKEETNRPVVAFMQTVAASGGYYTSVACDRIVAEPTVITGSIGVIVNHMVVKELLEEKLGIGAHLIRSAPKKAWPSLFDEYTEEGEAYLQEKLIQPAYERFVDLVDAGREDLSREDVLTLADGSIYYAQEALDKHLIDEIGYIDTAIAAAETLAGISDAQVIEYSPVFSWASLMESEEQSLLKIDPKIFEEMAVPKVMYLWRAE